MHLGPNKLSRECILLNGAEGGEILRSHKYCMFDRWRTEFSEWSRDPKTRGEPVWPAGAKNPDEKRP